VNYFSLLENKRISPQTSVRIARNLHEIVYQEPGFVYGNFFGKNRKSRQSELMTLPTFRKQLSERKLKKPIATSLDKDKGSFYKLRDRMLPNIFQLFAHLLLSQSTLTRCDVNSC
jgi:hypothetical protein